MKKRSYRCAFHTNFALLSDIASRDKKRFREIGCCVDRESGRDTDALMLAGKRACPDMKRRNFSFNWTESANEKSREQRRSIGFPLCGRTLYRRHVQDVASKRPRVCHFLFREERTMDDANVADVSSSMSSIEINAAWLSET